MERPSGVSSARLASCAASPAPVPLLQIQGERLPLAVPERDRACLVEQQGVYVASCFHSPAAHRQDCVARPAGHAGDADTDRRPRSSSGSGTPAALQGPERSVACRPHSCDSERGKREGVWHRHEEDQAQAQSGYRGRLVGCLPSLALNQRDHPVQERFTGVGRDADLIQSDKTLVPPVPALRSPPDSRMTGALYP